MRTFTRFLAAGLFLAGASVAHAKPVHPNHKPVALLQPGFMISSIGNFVAPLEKQGYEVRVGYFSCEELKTATLLMGHSLGGDMMLKCGDLKGKKIITLDPFSPFTMFEARTCPAGAKCRNYSAMYGNVTGAKNIGCDEVSGGCGGHIGVSGSDAMLVAVMANVSGVEHPRRHSRTSPRHKKAHNKVGKDI